MRFILIDKPKKLKSMLPEEDKRIRKLKKTLLELQKRNLKLQRELFALKKSEQQPIQSLFSWKEDKTQTVHFRRLNDTDQTPLQLISKILSASYYQTQFLSDLSSFSKARKRETFRLSVHPFRLNAKER